MQGLSGRLRASLGASGPLADSLTKGEMREEDVVAAFRPHLPGRYDLVKGVVINADGEESDPQDLILVDTSVLPTLLGSGNTRVVPVEGVVGVVQIKSRATAASVEHAVHNLASAKRLLTGKVRYGFPPSGAARPDPQFTPATFFAGALFLSKRGKDQSLAEAYSRAVIRVEPRERCDAFCVVDKFSILWGCPSNGEGLQLGFRAEQAESPLHLMTGPDSLLFFYLTLAEHLANWITPPLRWLDYVLGSDPSGRRMQFNYAYWYDEQNPPDWVSESSG
jgi:hypothetical protein